MSHPISSSMRYSRGSKRYGATKVWRCPQCYAIFAICPDNHYKARTDLSPLHLLRRSLLQKLYLSKHRGNYRVGDRRGFLIRSMSSVPNFSGNRPEFCHEFCPEIAPIFFGPFFRVQNSTPNPRHLRGKNPRQLWKLLSQWFLWVLDPGRSFWMPLFLCRPTKTC